MQAILNRLIITIGLFCFQFTAINAQSEDPMLYNQQWKAFWITAPGINPSDYGVYYFRKKIESEVIPKTFPVYISGDNRYKLYINEQLASIGPARGDVAHWNFEIVDLAPYLKEGSNIVAAIVWNDGKDRPEPNMTHQTGFIMQGGSDEASILNTNQSWKVIKCKGYTSIEIKLPSTSYRVGPGERVDMNNVIHGWKRLSFDDKDWDKALRIAKGAPKNMVKYDVNEGWYLMPSSLPQMELRTERIQKIRLAEGFDIPEGFPSRPVDLTIPANNKVKFILDQTYLTNAYLTMLFSKGKDAKVVIGYADCLYTKFPTEKGNRNDIEGKEFRGRIDEIIANGYDKQEYTTLFWRTYRYIQIEVETKDTPLIIHDIYGTFTGYPFELKAKLDTDIHDIKEIMDIGWRTARLCAFDTYFDCPQYEQLQYVGDTRIQGLISIYNSGDDRLLRNAINQIDYSRQPEGLVLSRYPSNTPLIISPFSVWYIGMLHDYMTYCSAPEFVKNKLPGARQIIHFFKNFQQEDGSYKNLPGWQFTDWVRVPDWHMGIRRTGEDGSSALLDLQVLYAYQWMIELENEIGMKAFASLYQEEADALKRTIRKKYWDDKQGLFADSPEKDLYSQHTNTLAILTDVVNKEEATLIAKKLLTEKSLAPASVYFKFYLHQALVKAGLGDDYLNWLDIWHENINMGLTTWGETSDISSTRSDCHAWGASPNIEFFRTILGIDSGSPGFETVIIKPHLGTIKDIRGEMPHPKGKIVVKYIVKDGILNAEINLPNKVSGELIWKNKTIKLTNGRNNINL